MSNRGTGIRVDRIYTGGPQDQAQDAERHERRTSSSQPILRRAVVIEVYYDPANQLTEEARESLRDEVANPDAIPRIRRNCILAHVISQETNRLDSKPQIFYPMMDPYISVPVKSGEQVFVIFEDPGLSLDDGFWLCRIPEPGFVDDVNYTHGDRRYIDIDNQDTIAKLEGGDTTVGFPNGDESEDSLTIGGPNEYEKIVDESSSYEQFTAEAIPRFTKRPGDTVIQGSNNAMIAFMTDRTSSATNPEETQEGRGSIYMATGRGQGGTAPETIQTSRDYSETDKRADNPREGDPDFQTDRSVFYMSMNTSIDENFDVNIPNGGEASPGDTAAVMIRTDQLRLHGRDDVKIQAGENGSGAAIVLKATGDIVLIPGPTGVIKLGGDDAGNAILTNTGQNAGGLVAGLPILTTMGGVAGTPDPSLPHGTYGTKVLIKS